MKTKATMAMFLVLGALMTGCDIPWQTVGTALAVTSYSGNPALALSMIDLDFGGGDESWWDEHDQDLEFLIWPIGEFLD